MISLLDWPYLALLQPEPLRATSSAVQFVATTGLSLIAFIMAIYFVLKYLRRNRDRSVVDEVRSEFEKSKQGLLLSAHQKNATLNTDTTEDQEANREAKEIELLKENVDPTRVFGQTCPLSHLEMMADQDLVIDPYTGQAYHFSSFLNDWPTGSERPKYVYRYPQGVVLKCSDLLTGF